MPAQSKKQQRFMGMVHAVQQGKMKAPSKEVADAAKSMSKADAEDFAKTKHKGLPEKKDGKDMKEKEAAAIPLGKVIKAVLGTGAVAGTGGYITGRRHGAESQKNKIRKGLTDLLASSKSSLSSKAAQAEDGKASRLASYLSFMLGHGLGSGIYGAAKTDSIPAGIGTGAGAALGGTLGSALGLGAGWLAPGRGPFKIKDFASGLREIPQVMVMSLAKRKPAALSLALAGGIIGGGEATKALTDRFMPKPELTMLDKVKNHFKKKGAAEYTKYLSQEERAQAMKFGAVTAFARKNVPISEIDNVVKEAFTMPSGGGLLEGVSKAIVTTAILTGVPLGVAAHMVNRAMDTNRRAEREQLARIDYYRGATKQLESGLTGVPPDAVKQ